jgi:methylated-DNA-[protein]-cysteine S-methyltransferase
VTNYCVFETEFGWIGMVGSATQVTRLTLPVESREEALRSVRAGFQIPPEQNGAGLPSDAVEDEAAFGSLPQMLRDYFHGKEVDLSKIAVDLDPLPPFARRALLECMKLPAGTVATYGEIARRAGSARACRAVGNAMASNPVPIIVPCHRVIRSNGGIGGFGAGLEMKRRLLKLEGIDTQC